jgi:hypothetical protein
MVRTVLRTVSWRAGRNYDSLGDMPTEGKCPMSLVWRVLVGFVVGVVVAFVFALVRPHRRELPEWPYAGAVPEPER